MRTLCSLRCSRSILPITECKLSLPYSVISLYNMTIRFIWNHSTDYPNFILIPESVPSGPSLWCLLFRILYAILLSSCVLEFSNNANQFHLFLLKIFHVVYSHKSLDNKTLKTDIFSCCSLTLAWRPNSSEHDAMTQVNLNSQDVMFQKTWGFMRYGVIKYFNTDT